ncbi:MAG: hypothetical protein ACRDGM_07875 [bacterium]
MVQMLPDRAVEVIRHLQAAIWSASRNIASPQVELILERVGVGTLAAQSVVVIWAKTSGQQRHVTSPGDDTPAIDLTFRRLTSDSFDVATGDRFTIDGQRGVVARVVRNKAVIRAESRLVSGTVWP